MTGKLLRIGIVVILMTLVIVSALFLSFEHNETAKVTAPSENTEQKEECVTKRELRTVRGNSMSPKIESGVKVEILFGYCDCHQVERGDTVIYSLHLSG